MLLNLRVREKIDLFAVVSGLLAAAIQISLGSCDEETDPGLFPIKSSFLVSMTILKLINNHLIVSSNMRETPKSKTLALLMRSTSSNISTYLGRCGASLLLSPQTKSLKTLDRNGRMLLCCGGWRESTL